jgi:phosphoribosylanthranilate isomerase
MWVKICGNTNLDDAALAAQLGADAVGFVFAASKRQVTPAQVAAIAPHLPHAVERVGVFDSHNADEIAGAALEAGLTAVQLHGGLDERLLERLREKLAARVRIIQTLHWAMDGADDNRTALTTQIKRVAELGPADRVLIDSKLGAASGGTGVAFDWARARDVFAAAPSAIRLIAAGGLRPENVAGAIAQLAPWGVDVVSGVEASPGQKDPALLARFIQNARAATP